jgi:hypothetical protein
MRASSALILRRSAHHSACDKISTACAEPRRTRAADATQRRPPPSRRAREGRALLRMRSTTQCAERLRKRAPSKTRRSTALFLDLRNFFSISETYFLACSPEFMIDRRHPGSPRAFPEADRRWSWERRPRAGFATPRSGDPENPPLGTMTEADASGVRRRAGIVTRRGEAPRGERPRVMGARDASSGVLCVPRHGTQTVRRSAPAVLGASLPHHSGERGREGS